MADGFFVRIKEKEVIKVYLWYQLVDGTGIHYTCTSSPLTNAIRNVKIKYKGRGWHLINIGVFDEYGNFVYICEDVLGECRYSQSEAIY